MIVIIVIIISSGKPLRGTLIKPYNRIKGLVSIEADVSSRGAILLNPYACRSLNKRASFAS